MSKKLKIIYIDVENSHDIIAKFGLYPEYINPSQIIQGWYMFCACWAYNDEKTIHGASIHQFTESFLADPTNDRHVVKALRDAIMEADVVVAHNGDKFDLPKLNARLVYHRLDPLPTKLKTIDTLKLAKKHFKYTSNRLDYLGKYFNVGAKTRNPEGLWMDALNGDETALKQMFKYCKNDIVLLRDVFKVMQPYVAHTMFTEGITEDCPKCGGALTKQGSRKTISSTGLPKQRFKCSECASWFQASVKADGTLGRIGNG